MSVTRKILIFCFLLICPSVLYAGITIETKNGAIFEWDNYTEEENQYCTFKYSGRICVQKMDVASFKQNNRSDIDMVIQPIIQPTASNSTPGIAYAESQTDKGTEKERPLEGMNADIYQWCAEKGGQVSHSACLLGEYIVESGVKG